MSLNSSSSNNPFPGLRPFRSDEHHLFFGREEQTAALLQLLRKNRFLAIVGTSGSGKSSLVRAGMIAELHGGTMTHAGSTWEVMILRPGGSPIENLARAMVEGDLYDAEDSSTLPRLRATLTRSRFGLVEAMRQSDVFEPGVNLLVVVDQFEELFRFRQQGGDSEETATAFVNLLLTASEQAECPIYIAITMRSDYLGDCSEIPGLAEAVNEGEYLIPRLLRDQKRDAIEKPIGVGGAKISPLLVQRLLNDVGDDPDQLPVLQHALMRTWEVWAAGSNQDRPIDLSDFEATGGLADALSNHADELYASLPDDRHRAVCERVFKSLTEKGSDNRGIRRPARLAMLQAIADADRRTLGTVLDAFRQAGVTFLMPGMDTELTERTIIDLSHESLMRGWQRLRMWVEEESQSARIFRRLLDTARLWSEGKAGLFRDPDLHIALSWRDEEQPNAEWADQYGGQFQTAINFLDASNAEVEAEQNAREAARQHELEQAQRLAEAERQRASDQARAAVRFRRFARGLAVVAVVALLATVFAWRARQEADKQRTVAVTAQENTEKALKDVEAAKKLADQNLVKAKAAEDAALAAELRSREFRYATDIQWVSTVVSDAKANATQSMARLADHDPKQNQEIKDKEDLRGFEWHYLQRLIASRATVMSGFTADPTDAAVNQEGELVTLDKDLRLQFWEMQTGTEARPALNLKRGRQIAQSALSPDGRLVAYTAANKVHVANTSTGEELFPPLPTASGYGLVFTPDGRMLVTVDASVTWWDAATGRPFATGDSNTTRGGPISLSSDGRLLVKGHSPWVSAYRLDPESRDVRIVLDNTNLAFGGTRAYTVSPDGQFAVVSQMFSADLRLYEMAKGTRVKGNSTEHAASVSAIAFHPDGAGMLTGAMDGALIIWRDFRALDKADISLVGHSGEITKIFFADNGSKVVSLSRDRTARVWDLSQSKASLQQMVDGSSDALGEDTGVARARFSPDGLFVATTQSGGPMRILDADTGEVVRFLPARSDGMVADSVAFSPDNRLLALGFGGKADVSFVELWDLDEAKLIATMPGLSGIPGFSANQNSGVVSGLEFSPDGKYVAAGFGSLNMLAIRGTVDHPLVIYDVASRRPIRWLMDHKSYTTSIDFSRDGSRMASASFDGTTILWDTASWKPIHILSNPDVRTTTGYQRVFDASFSPDGSQLATASFEGSVHVWDTASGKLLRTLTDHSSGVSCVRFSPDGRTLASGGFDTTIRLWNTATWRGLMTFEPGVGMEPRDIRFSPDSSRLVAVGGPALMWSARPDGEPRTQRFSEQLETLLDSKADFSRRIRMLSDNPRLEGALRKLSDRHANSSPVRAALSAARAHRHATRQEWAEAVKQIDLLKESEAKAEDWLTTPGLVRLAAALVQENRTSEAAALLRGRRKHLADEALDVLSRRSDSGIRYKAEKGSVRISGIWPGSPASRASLRVGDVILKVNDQDIAGGDTNKLDQLLQEGKTGTQIRLAVRHADNTPIETVELVKGNYPVYSKAGESFRRQLQSFRAELDRLEPSPAVYELRAELAELSSDFALQVTNYSAAIESLEKLESKPDADLRRLHSRRGNAYVELKQWQQAFDDYSKGITDDTTDEELLTNQARAQAESVRNALWTVLKPVEMTSVGGATLVLQDDGSILATGKDSDNESYRLVLETKLKTITAIRVEALTHESLPRKGPGRGAGGNFGISWRFSTARKPAGEEAAPLRIKTAVADFLHQRFPITTNSWNIAGGEGQPHIAVLQLETPLETDADTQIVMTINGPSGQYSDQDLGCFRLSVSGDSDIFNKRDEVIAAFQTNQILDPWTTLAAAHRRRDDQQTIDQLVTRRPQAAGAIGDLFINGDKRDWQRAAEIYSKGITPETTDVELLGKRAKAYEGLKDWKSAATDWSRAAGENPKGAKLLADFAGRLLHVEQIELAVQQRQRARDILEATLKTDSGDAPAIDVLAALLLDMSEPVPKWATLKPAELKMTSGATLALQDDQSLLVERKPHVITLADPGNSLQAIRIETSSVATSAGQDAPAFKEYRILSTGLPVEGFRGRYVRLDLPGDNTHFPRDPRDGANKVINLAELEILRGDQNLAFHKAASQSSTYGTEEQYGANHAVNGDTEGREAGHLYAHTRIGDPDPWWEVDLGSDQVIDRIVVWNRTEFDIHQRMHHFRIQILDESRRVVFERVIDKAPNPSTEIVREVQLAKIEPDGADGVAQWRMSLDGNLARRFRISRELNWNVLKPSTLTTSEGTQITAQDDGSFVAKASDSGEVKLSELPARTKTVRFETASVSKQAPSAAAAYKDYRIEAVDASRSETGALKGRYVRIDLPGDNQDFPRRQGDAANKIINLAELQVFRSDENIALRKTARQSSDYSRDHIADRAVDGTTFADARGDGSINPFANTKSADPDPWWEVDLGGMHEIDRVAVWNRTGRDLPLRMNHFRVRVLDEDRNVVLEQVIDEAPKPSREIDCHSWLVAKKPGQVAQASRWSFRPLKEQRYRISTADTLLRTHASTADQPDILLADFEGQDYGEWRVTGVAFGPGPARGTLPQQTPVDGFLGKGLANSYFNGDGTTGTLTSPQFKIERRFIRFLIGGGKSPDRTCINLLVDGKVVRTATGTNDRPGGSERLDWHSWDVGEVTGKTATIAIVDQATGGWGHINIDHIVQTDRPLSSLSFDSTELAWTAPELGNVTPAPGTSLTPQAGGSFVVQDHEALIALPALADTVKALRRETASTTGSNESVAPAFKDYRAEAINAPRSESGSLQGRFVLIDLPGDNVRFPRRTADRAEKWLTIAEIQVFQADRNIALNQSVRQSSTHKDPAAGDWAAGRAVDGDTDGKKYATMSSTTGERDPWWEVDLASQQPMDKIVIWNRTEEDTTQRMNHFRIRVLDADRNIVFEQVIDEAPNPSREIDCQSMLVGASPAADGKRRWAMQLGEKTAIDLKGRFRISSAEKLSSPAQDEAYAAAKALSPASVRLASAFERLSETSPSTAWFRRALDEAKTGKKRSEVLKHLQFRPEPLAGLLKEQPDDVDLQLALARRHVIEGQAQLSRKAPQAALTEFESARDIFTRLLAQSPEPQWTVLKPVEMKSEGGATLTLQKDASILVSGENPDEDTYTLVTASELSQVTAFRLEALSDRTLPKSGPGRYEANGNFHLNELRVTADGKPVTLTEITVGHDEADEADRVIDGKVDRVRGWSNDPRSGQSNAAVVATKTVSLNGGPLTFQMYFSRGDSKKHGLGRFRLSATSAANAVTAARLRNHLPNSELAALDIVIGNTLAQLSQPDEAANAFARALGRIDKEQERKPLIEQFQEHQAALTVLAGLRPKDSALQLALAKSLATSGRKALDEKRDAEALPQLSQAQKTFAKLASEHAQTEWTVLRPLEMKTEAGADMELQEDGSVFVERPGGNDTYTLVFESELKGIKGLRLEALADARLPGGGPGWFNDGNFVLSELSLEVASATDSGQPRSIALQNAFADFSQEHWHVQGAIDGNGTTGWAVGSEFNKDHVAVFETAEDLGNGELTRLTIRLNHQFEYLDNRHLLGRFRLSVTSDTNAAKVAQFQHDLKTSGLRELQLALGNAYGRQRKLDEAATAFSAAFDLAVDREASSAILTAAAAHEGVLARMTELRSNHATFNDVLARHHFDKANVAAGRTAAATARRLYEAQIAAEPANSKVTKDLADLLLSISPVEWTVLKPTRMTSEGEATLTLLGDGSVLAGGKNPDTDTYSLVVEEPIPATSVIRLEVLNDDSLPQRGPGRHTNGLFVLARFEVREGLDSSSSLLQAPPFSEAKADVSYLDTPLELQSGRWHLGWLNVRKPHVAYYRLNKSVSGPVTLRLIFENNPDYPKLTLGRFRISVSDDSQAYATENVRLASLKNANPWSRLATAYGALGESDKAVETIVRAYERTSSDAAKAALAQEVAAQDDLFPKLLDKFPNDGALRLGQAKYLATKHVAENRFQQAVNVLSGIQSDFPDDIELLNQRASALMKLANWKAAEADYARVIALETDEGRRRDAERSRAEVQLRLGQYKAGASAYFEQMILAPGDVWLQRNGATAQLLAGNSKRSNAAARQFLRRSGAPNKDLSNWLVWTHVAQPGAITKENSQLLLAAAKSAESPWTAPMTAAIHYRLGELSQAEPLLTSTNGDLQFQCLAAMLLYDQGKVSEAQALLKNSRAWLDGERARDLNSHIPARHAWQTWTVYLVAWREAARKLIGPRMVALDELLAKEPDKTAELLERARLLFNAGLHDEALDDLERLAALNFDSPEVHTLHGQVLVELRRDDEALPILQRTIEGGTQDAGVFAARGTILLKQEQTEAARADLEKSLELQPTELAARSLVTLLLAEAAKATTWTVLKPAEMKSEGGATLTLQEDGSILASGEHRNRDVYVLEVPVNVKGITGIALELLPHESLPHGGIGRGVNGQTMVSEFEVARLDDSGKLQTVPLSAATADFEQKDQWAEWKAAHVIDGKHDTRAWGVAPRLKERHLLVVKPAEPITAETKALRILIRQDHFNKDHPKGLLLGRFRLSVSNHPDAFTRESARLAALKSDNPWLRLALARLIHGDRAAAAANLVLAFQRGVDHNQRSEVFEQASQHNDLFPEFTRRLADDPRLQVFHGTQFASKGQWQEADAAYRRAVELDASAVGHWIQAGYWKVENYPAGLAKAQPPENDPNPFLAVSRPAQKGNASAVEWQVVTPETGGRFNFGNAVACHYVLTRLWSPREQEVALQMGDDDSLRLFVNGGLGFESKSSGGDATRIEYEIAAKLQPGWNNVLVKLENSNSTGALILKLSNAEQDLIAARLGSRLYEGVRLVRAGNRDEGIDLLMQSIGEQSTDATLFARRAQVFQSLELWQHAADDWGRADKINPLGRIDGLYLEHQAGAFSAMRQRENELSVWTTMLRRDEEGIYSGVANWFHRARANTYRSMRQWDKARADYDRSIALTPPVLLADFLLDRGRFFAMQGKWREAADDFVAAVTHKSATDYIKTNWGVSREYALVQLMAGDLDGYRNAAAEMERRLGNVQASGQAPWLLRVQIAGPGGVTDGNLDRLRKANALTDDWHRPRMDAALLFRSGRYNEAVKLFEQKPGGVEYQLMAAMAHQKLGNRARAQQLFDAANKWLFEQAGDGPLEVAPDSQESWWWIPMLALRQETIQQITDQRLPELEKLLEADPANAAALAERALLHASIGDHKRSLADLDRAIADNASSPELFGARGRVLAKLDRTDEALADLNKAVERNSQDAQVYAERGTILAKRGDVESADDDLKRSLALEPGEAVAQALADLLLSQIEKSVQWTVLRPTVAKSEGGATLTLQEDGSVLASGLNSLGDAYRITAPVPKAGILRAIRLEALTHDSLPANGPGRDEQRDRGNFAMIGFDVQSVSPGGIDRPVPLSQIAATYFHQRLGITHWNVGGRGGRPHTAFYQAENPTDLEKKSSLEFRMRFSANTEWPLQNLGCFRLSVSEDPDAFTRENARLAALKLDNPWLRLAHARLLNNDLSNAVISFALAFQRAGDDTQRSAIFEQVSEHGDIFPEFINRIADDPQFHLLIGKRLAAQGKWAESDATFRKAATLEAAVLPKWIQTGFWKVESYPFGLNTPQPPESNPEPFEPVGRPGKDGKLADVSWQAVTVGSNGRFSFGTERACHYLLTRLWSPAEQEIAVQMGDDDNLRMFVNDKLLFESVPNGGAANPKEHEIAAQLRSGWNTVLVKLQNDSDACNLVENFSNDPADLVTARWGSRLFDAVQLANGGKKDDALAALKELIGENSQNVTMHAKRAEAYNQLKEWKLAEADYLRTTELNPKSEARWRTLGDFHQSRQQLDSAIAAFTKSLELLPNNGFALYRRAFSYAELGRWQEAMADINLAVEHRNDGLKQDFQLKRADLWRRQAKWQEAARDMREVAATGADSAKTWTFSRDLAVVELAAGDLKAWQLAVAEADKRIGTNPNGDQARWLVFATVSGPATITAEQHDRLLKIVDDKLTDKEAAWKPCLQAALLYRTGKFQGAADLFDKNTNGPASAAFQFHAAMAHHKLGHDDQAKKLFDQTNTWIAGQEGKEATPAVPKGHGWLEWAIYKSLQHEATSLRNEAN